jgi:hypothetical protein
MAVLAAFRAATRDGGATDLARYLADHVFVGPAPVTADPDPADVAGFAAYLDRYRAGLAVERAAVDSL